MFLIDTRISTGEEKSAAEQDAADVAKLAKANKDTRDTKKIALPEGVPALPTYNAIQEGKANISH